MAIAPNDPRRPDLSASDVLSPHTWPRRGTRPTVGIATVGLDVLCTKIAVDFQTMTADSAAECIVANLELLREATRADVSIHMSFDAEATTFLEGQGPRGRLAPGNPEQLRGESLEALPWLKSRLASLRVSEIRDTGHPRSDQVEDAAVWWILGIAGARPRDNWEVQLHLLMKLIGSSLATGLERIELQAHLRDLEERNDLALYSANDGLWDFDTLNNRVYMSPRWKAM